MEYHFHQWFSLAFVGYPHWRVERVPRPCVSRESSSCGRRLFQFKEHCRCFRTGISTDIVVYLVQRNGALHLRLVEFLARIYIQCGCRVGQCEQVLSFFDSISCHRHFFYLFVNFIVYLIFGSIANIWALAKDTTQIAHIIAEKLPVFARFFINLIILQGSIPPEYSSN